MLKTPEEITQDEHGIFLLRVARVYTTLPITKRELFAGRTSQMAEALGAIFNPGHHVIIFGEPGVGKTSMASVLDDFAQAELTEQEIIVSKVDCSSEDDFDSVWRRIFSQIDLEAVEGNEEKRSILDLVGKTEITPYVVLKQLSNISPDSLIVLVFDEFNIIKNKKCKLLFAETIKSLSNNAVPSTIFLVGVADNVDELIEQHQLAGRNLIQIHMPRMTLDEAKQILIDNGLEKVGMGIEDGAVDKIIRMAQGLPSYVHTLGKHAALIAIDEMKRNVRLKHVDGAIDRCLEQATHSVKSSYTTATSSPRENLFEEVLLACALAKKDDLGTFAAVDVRAPFRRVTSNPEYDIQNFLPALNKLSSEGRDVLVKSGTQRNFRYKFKDALLQPYILMQGIKSGKITQADLSLA